MIYAAKMLLSTALTEVIGPLLLYEYLFVRNASITGIFIVFWDLFL